MAPGELTHLLADYKSSDERVLVGIGSSDDAAVWKIDDKRALIQTLDVITPVVDDPYYYGQIAAANSMSDIFAMGGEVATAMNMVGFDGCNHPKEVLSEILAGGATKVQECGGVIVGGHTIETPEMIYGLSVSGFADIDKIYRNDTPRVGDLLILTKPLGIGIATTAIKADMLSNIKDIVSIMAQLNYRASVLMRDFDVSAVTDITGFGLAGHSYEMSGEGRVTIEFEYNSLPILKDAIDLANMGIIPAGTYNNKSYISSKTDWRAKADDIIFYDAQTSGGLLIAVSSKDAKELLNRLIGEGYEYSAIIGEIKPPQEKALIVS